MLVRPPLTAQLPSLHSFRFTSSIPCPTTYAQQQKLNHLNNRSNAITEQFTKTQHTATFSGLIGEESIVLRLRKSEWEIDTVDGWPIASGEQWIDAHTGERKLSVDFLAEHASGDKVREFVLNQPATNLPRM